MRPSKRQNDEMRAISFERGVSKHAEGSAWSIRRHACVCTASLEEKVPAGCEFRMGWVTAEYGMLPRSTGELMRRRLPPASRAARTLGSSA